MQDYLSVKEFATILGINQETVRRWIRDNKINAEYIGGSVGYRIKFEELKRYTSENKSTRYLLSDELIYKLGGTSDLYNDLFKDRSINTSLQHQKIVDCLIKEKSKAGVNITIGDIIIAAIYNLIDFSAYKNAGNNSDFIDFESAKYDFMNYPDTMLLIEELINAKAELVIARFKSANYLTENGLHTASVLELPGIVEHVDNEFRVAEKLLFLSIHQIIHLDGDIDGPKNMIFKKALELLMKEPQNQNKEAGYYYFSK